MMRRTAAVLIVVGVVGTGSLAFAQQVKARIDGAVVKQYVTTLAARDMEGRKTLTPGFARAADWAVARFREWGLKPAGEAGTFVQAVPLTGPKGEFVWAAGLPALSVDGRAFSFKEGDFTVDLASSAGADVAAEAVFAGYGISAPAKGLDEYAGIDVTGKIVVVLTGSPVTAPPDDSDYPPDLPPVAGTKEPWTAESSDAAKIMTAYGRGAAAILLCDPDQTRPAARRADREPVEASPFTRPFLVARAADPHVLRAVLLRDPQESLAGFTDRVNRIRRDVQRRTPRSAATGVRVRLKGYDTAVPYGAKFANNVSRNILAKIEGSDPVLRRQYVIVGAHLDHLGFRNGLVHPGADDNASGSSVVLEVARQFATSGLRPRRTVIFALWCGEEIGHFGSRHYTDSPSDGVSMDRVAAYINMDMVGLGATADAMGARDFPALYGVMARDQLPEITRVIRPDVSGPGGSDYAPFLAHGVEAIALFSSGGSGHPDYHDSGDVPERIQPEILGAVGQFVMQAAYSVANETKTPLPTPGRGLVCDGLRFTVHDLAGAESGAWRTLPVRTPRDMLAEVVRTIGDLKRPHEAAPSEDEPAPRVGLGARAEAFGGNTALLETAAAALGIGRVDMSADDGEWVRGGLTAAGRGALAAMESREIVLHLVRPSAALLDDVLSTAVKPFLVTAAADPDDALAHRLAARNAVMVVPCRADDVAGCAAHLQRLRVLLGGSDHLAVSMSGNGDTTAAARALYMALRQGGWGNGEIYAAAGETPAGEPGGVLARFGVK